MNIRSFRIWFELSILGLTEKKMT